MFSDTGRFDPKALAVLSKSFVEMKTAGRARHEPALYRGIPAAAGVPPLRKYLRAAAIRIKGVSHQFGEKGDARHVVALRDTSLNVARGELLCLIGPSGCGKSTLLNVIGGLMEPSTGTVEVSGKPVRGPMPHDIAFVFQENALFPWNTVIENVDLGMVFQGVPRAEREARAKRSLAAVGLKDFAEQPAQLSADALRGAARALSRDRILLMDELFARRRADPHDPARTSRCCRRPTRLSFVTHSLGEATFLAGPVAVFSARPGTIKQIIAVDEPHPRKPDSSRPRSSPPSATSSTGCCTTIRKHGGDRHERRIAQRRKSRVNALMGRRCERLRSQPREAARQPRRSGDVLIVLIVLWYFATTRWKVSPLLLPNPIRVWDVLNILWTGDHQRPAASR